MVYTDDIVFSSTNLINRFLNNTSDDMREYLNVFKKRYTVERIHDTLDKMQGLKVLVIGDTILDDYHYGDTIGKSNKDPVLALKYKSNDMFAGGVLAVANHLAGFAKQIDLFTVLGEKDSQENFIRASLRPEISPNFVYHPESPNHS